MRDSVLIRALVHNQRATDLYQNNSEFHHGINILARALPRFVDCMAEEAVESERRREQVERLMATMPLTMPEEWR